MQEEVNKGKYLLVQDIMDKNIKQTKAFIEELEEEQFLEDNRIEDVDVIRNEMKADIINTDMKKAKFIAELKTGLGKEIKLNQGVKRVVEDNVKIKVTLADKLRNLFTKF